MKKLVAPSDIVSVSRPGGEEKEGGKGQEKDLLMCDRPAALLRVER